MTSSSKRAQRNAAAASSDPGEAAASCALPAGKIPADLLRNLLASLATLDPSVCVGAAVGEDAAVIDLGGDDLLVVKTDPITFAAAQPGRYLLAVNGNDLATMGAEPRWLLVTALMAEGSAAQDVLAIFEDLRQASIESGVALVGGHTEITLGLNRTILAGSLLGTVPRNRLLRTSGARPADAILLAGGIAIEGTAVLAAEHSGALASAGVPAGVVTRAAGWLSHPGISVLPAARILRDIEGIHAMHDPTEGGLATALHEMAEAAGVGLRIDRAAVEVLPECSAICRALGIDPLGLLASGALLATLEPRAATAALSRLLAAGIPAARIGETVALSEGRVMIDNGRERLLGVFARDELARYLETPAGKGL